MAPLFILVNGSIIFVPLSERRHRLEEAEIPEVRRGLRLRLRELLEKKSELDRAEITFRCLQRLMSSSRGRPRYFTISWEFLEYFLDSGPTE